MPLVAAAAIPSIPTAADLALLADLPDFDTAVLVGSGSELLVHHAPIATTSPQGGAPSKRALTVDEPLLRAFARRGQAPRTHSGALNGVLGALAVYVIDARPGATLVPVSVGSRAEPHALAAVAAGLAGAVDALDQAGAGRARDAGARRVVVVAAGDLAHATVCGDDPARRWDDQAAAALSDGEAAAFAELGPPAARQVGATGWAPLTVLLWLMQQRSLRVRASTYHLDGHVGRVSALALPGPPQTDPRAQPGAQQVREPGR